MRNTRKLAVLLVILVGAVGVLFYLLGREDEPVARAPLAVVTEAPSPPPIVPVAAPPQPALPPPSIVKPGASMRSTSDPDPIGAGTGTIKGRVLFDRRPVTRFGLFLTVRDFMVGYEQPRQVEVDDGRFTLEHVAAGTWTLFIAAPGIERIMTKVEIEADEVIDLGDLNAGAGQVITGRVLDGASQPIVGATVERSGGGGGMRIATITTLDGRPLTTDADIALADTLHARMTNTTDANGRYELRGVPWTEETEIYATHPKLGRSKPMAVPDGKRAIVDLVIGATGVIEGRVSVPMKRPARIEARLIGERSLGHHATADAQGNFRIEKLDAGTYQVVIDATPLQPGAWQPRVVTVPMNGRASVSFDAPATTVSLTVDVCDPLVVLKSPRETFGSPILSWGTCKDGKRVHENVEPGRYRACHDGNCYVVNATSKPAVQLIAVPKPR